MNAGLHACLIGGLAPGVVIAAWTAGRRPRRVSGRAWSASAASWRASSPSAWSAGRCCVTCFLGTLGGARPTANLSRGRRVATATTFGVLQLAAVWASLQPFADLR